MMATVLVSPVVSCQKGAATRCDARYGTGDRVLTVATGSPGELGLLEQLAIGYCEENTGTAICWIKAGTGESLDLLKQGKADAVMVHAPEAEKRAVSEGWAAGRRPIGSNEYYIIGPRDDPADISKSKTAVEAYRRIAKQKTTFISRGDNSGTHRKESEIWRKAGVTPRGKWYVVTKEFMSAALQRADALKGYFMTDSSTWIMENGKCKNLRVLFKGDPILINRYHVLIAPERRVGNHLAGTKFAEFLVSDKGQGIIRSYGKDVYGEALYSGI
jgi:tungstate transport system substrate-binding protein